MVLVVGCSDEQPARTVDGQQPLLLVTREEPWHNESEQVTRSGETLSSLQTGIVRQWDFTQISVEDAVALAADATNWNPSDEGSFTRYTSLTAMSGVLRANGKVLQMTSGLSFSSADAGEIRIDVNKRFQLNGSNITLTIPNLMSGQTVTIEFEATDATAATFDTRTNLSSPSGFTAAASGTRQTGTATVTSNGAVTLTNTTSSSGLNIYSITVTNPKGFGLYCSSFGLENQQVLWEGTRWDYGYNNPAVTTLLWPNNSVNTSVDLVAYVPYMASPAYNAGTKKLTFVPAVRNFIDLLWAEKSVNASTGVITLNFRHALGKLSFGTITNNFAKPIKLTRIQLSDAARITSGDLLLTDGTWSNTSTAASNDYDDLNELVLTGGVQNIPMPSIMQIPGQTVTVTFTITNQAGTATETVSKVVTFEQGVNKILSLTVDLNHEVVIK